VQAAAENQDRLDDLPSKVSDMHTIHRLIILISIIVLSPDRAVSEEFLAHPWFDFTMSPTQPGRIPATGHAIISDRAGESQLGGIVFYCAIPEPYIDIYVHKPGTDFLGNEYFWGTPTLRTTVKLNGSNMPGSVEGGIIVIDIKPPVKVALTAAFDLGPKADQERRLHFEVANFATCDLLLAPARSSPSSNPPKDIAIVGYSAMTKICDGLVAQEQGLRKPKR
jgi:hypothetical protein